METKTTCPLGHTCKKIVDDHIEVCAWLTGVAGKDPQTDEDINEERCAIAWQPILMIEMSGTNRQVAASVQSLRNETVDRQDRAMQLIGEVSNVRAIESK